MKIHTVLRGHKIEIYPTDFQKEIINITIGAARKMYNSLHEQFLYRANLTKVEKEVHKYQNYTALKNKWDNDANWLKQVSCQALSNTEYNYKKAWNNFKQNPKDFNIPTFKKKGKSKNSYSLCRNTVKNDIRIEGKYIVIPKLGKVKLSQKLRFNGIINKITISKLNTGRYICSVLVEYEERVLSNKGKKSGVDLGLTEYIIDNHGYKVNNPRFYRKLESKLIKEQRILSRKIEQAKKNNRNYEDCKNLQKQKIKVAKLHEKIKNQRIDFLHKLTTQLCEDNQFIALESLTVKNMIKNKKLAKSIQDAAWGEFVRHLLYKSKQYGTTIVQIDRWSPTSKICSSCGCYHPEVVCNLSIREWVCPSCEAQHDRDINAAKNIFHLGIKEHEEMLLVA